MNLEKTSMEQSDVRLEFDVDEPPQKVWRAISIPEFRAVWLPNDTLANPDPVSITPDEEVSYRLREESPPFLESTVTFMIVPNAMGGTRLSIIHKLTDERLHRTAKPAANSNSPILMLAA